MKIMRNYRGRMTLNEVLAYLGLRRTCRCSGYRHKIRDDSTKTTFIGTVGEIWTWLRITGRIRAAS